MLLLLFAVFVLVGVVAIATHGNKTANAGGTSATTNADATTTSSAASAQTGKVIKTAVGPQALFDVEGTGADTIGRFLISTTAARWEVKWSYNCSDLGVKHTFNFTVVNAQTSRPDPTDLGPNQHGMTGSGVEDYHDSGTVLYDGCYRVPLACRRCRGWVLDRISRGAPHLSTKHVPRPLLFCSGLQRTPRTSVTH